MFIAIAFLAVINMQVSLISSLPVSIPIMPHWSIAYCMDIKYDSLLTLSYWSALVLRIIYRAVILKTIKDERSDDEDEGEEDVPAGEVTWTATDGEDKGGEVRDPTSEEKIRGEKGEKLE